MKRSCCSIIPIFIPHLGCPHRCVFCDQRQIAGSPMTQDVQAEIQAALDKLDASATAPGAAPPRPQIAFYGGSFTAIPAQLQEKFLAIGQAFIQQGRVRSLRCSTRPDCVDSRTMDRLAQYGIETVELGIQSMDPQVLLQTKRGHTPEQAQQAARQLKAAGFQLVLQMMTGLPGDTPKKSLETARQMISLEPDAVRIYPTVVLPGTELEAIWRSGRYQPQTVEQAVALCAELLALFDEAKIPVIRLGLNPSSQLESSVLAGAYHPALGDLARSRLWLNRICTRLGQKDRLGQVLRIFAPLPLISPMAGHRRCNIEALQQRYGFRSIRLYPGSHITLQLTGPDGQSEDLDL